MENPKTNLPQSQAQQTNTSSVSRKELNTIVRVAELVKDVNMLAPFPLEGPQIMHWAKDLVRLLPMEELMKLPFLMDQFKLENVIWDKTLGIQNIIRGLRQVEHTIDGFKLNKPIY